MRQEKTDGREDLFLALRADTILYVLPLADVGQIVAAVPEGTPEIFLSDCEESGGGSVIFQDDQGFAALTAGKITGIVRLPPACQFEIPAPARSVRNRWIAGVALREETGELCYLLDCRQLRARFLQEAR